jgi:predicted HTH domain antitoxin
MNISFEIPHEIEQQIKTNGLDANGRAREAFLVELYREHKITHRQLGDALGLERYDTDGVLKRYGVGLSMSVEEIKADAGLLQHVRPS